MTLRMTSQHLDQGTSVNLFVVNANSKQKAPFRFLTDEQEVWSQNAWDHVPPPDDQDEIIAKALEKQKSNPVPLDEKVKYNEKPAKHWSVQLVSQ